MGKAEKQGESFCINGTAPGIESIVGEGFRLKGFWGVFYRIIDSMAFMAGAILVFITAAVCYTIGMRYLFTKTTIWIMQTTEYALLWIGFFWTPWLFREKG